MLTVAEATDHFLASLQRRHAPLTTLKAYGGDLRQFARVVPADLAAVDAAAVEAFLAGDGTLSPATGRRRHATLSSFYRWLVRHDLVAASPMERVERGTPVEYLPRPLDPTDVARILDTIPPKMTRDRALFWLLYETGMRIGEALSLQVSDVHLAPDDDYVRVLGKGGRERTVLLTAAPQSIRLLRRHLTLSRLQSGSVFRGDPRFGGSNRPMDYTTARRAWLGYCQAAGLTATIHQLRHSRATELTKAGVPVTTIRKLLGHRSLQSTLLYVEVAPETIKQDLLAYQRRRGRPA